jgi:hypothetical protein
VNSNIKDFLKQLNDTTSFKRKIDLCNNTLQKIGVGSSRVVYDFGDNKVLKLAKNAKGLAQNSVEWDMYRYSGDIELLNTTHDTANDSSYIIAEKANKITKNKFVQLTHIPNIKDIYELRDVLNNCLRVYFYPRNSNPHLTDEQVAYYNDLLENNDFISSLVTLINDFRIQLNDLLRPANLGIINENGKEKLVIIDYGFNDDVARNSYGYKNVGMYENKKLKSLIESLVKKELRKVLNEVVNSDDTIQDYIDRYREEAKVKDFLDNNLKYSNCILKFAKDVVKHRPKYSIPQSNKCETNVFDFIKSDALTYKFDKYRENITQQRYTDVKERYFPVSGWIVTENYYLIDHFWIYDSVDDVFLEITPLREGNHKIDLYCGAINYNINDKIREVNKHYDIPFLKGGKTIDELYKSI